MEETLRNKFINNILNNHPIEELEGMGYEEWVVLCEMFSFTDYHEQLELCDGVFHVYRDRIRETTNLNE